MKNIFFITLLILFFGTIQAQVAINDDNSIPDPSAMLDIKSTDKGLLVPRLTIAERDLISNPATGLMVFITDENTFYFYNGTIWSNLDAKWLSNGSDIYNSNTGNVGIGANPPQSKLDVAGDVRLIGNAIIVDGNQTLTLKTNELGGYAQVDIGGSGHSSDSIYIGDYSATSNEVIMNGKVGVGTIDLTDKLNVKGDVRIHRTSSTSNNKSVLTIEGSQSSGFEFARIDFQNLDRDSNTDYVGARIIASNGLGSEDGDLRFYTTTSGDVGDFNNQVMRINKGRSIGIRTSSNNIFDALQVGISGDGTRAIANEWATWSDKRLKKDFLRIDEPLQKLAQLNGYYYFWKGEGKSEERQVGVIAQEVEAVLPELVNTNEDDVKSVDYAKLVALLIEVNKEQQTQLNAVTQQTQLLQQKVEKLEMQVSKINELKAEN